MNKDNRIIILILAALAILGVAGFFLSGAIFLYKMKIGISSWTPTILYDYWAALGHEPVYAKVLRSSLLMGFLVAYGVPAILVGVALQKKRSLHGDARFATFNEIKKAGLMGTDGILIGKYKGKYLSFSGQQFVAVSAPTRGGKGVGIVIPNLLNYPYSVVVLDVKQENFDITAGFRAKYGQEVYLFDPFAEDGRTHRYNPLGYIRDDPMLRPADAMALASILYPAADAKNMFFDLQARSFFVGIALMVLESPDLPHTFGELLRQSVGDGSPIKEYFQKKISDRKESGTPYSSDCVNALNTIMAMSDNTMSSVIGTFNAPLTIWRSPIVDAATSGNDFDLRDVRKKKMSIYIGITPDHISEASLLLNLFFAQLVNLNTKELPKKNPDLKYPCLLLMDEFTAMGRVDIIAKAVSHMAGYNLRLLPIFQSIAQLASVYGENDARNFMTNHACQVLFAPREQRDAEEYSKILGTMTVKATSKSRNKGGINIDFTGRGSNNSGGGSESQSDHARPLLLPQEFRELGMWRVVITIENIKPIQADKIKYFDDPVFKARLFPPPDIPSLDLGDIQAAKKVQDDVLRDAEQLRLQKDSEVLETPEPTQNNIANDTAIHSEIDEIRARVAAERAALFSTHDKPTITQPRPVTLAEIESGEISLDDLEIDLSNLQQLPEETVLSTEEAAALVGDIFAAMGIPVESTDTAPNPVTNSTDDAISLDDLDELFS